MRWPAWLSSALPPRPGRAASWRASLYGIATDDRLTFVAAPLALVAAALIACYVPARRATRIEPMEVLRFE